MCKSVRVGILVAIISLIARTIAPALTIQLDYSYDAANGNFFGQNPTAKAAVDAAAADLNALIAPTLGPVTTDVYTGSNGGTTATFDWKLTYTNPSTGATVTLNTFSFPTDSLTIFVGMRPLSGSTLGQGGPGGAGFSLNGSGSPGEWTGAIAAAESKSNAGMGRGGGPIIGTISGTSTFGASTAFYDLQYGAMIGSLVFDNDTNNDSVIDSASTLANFWNFSHLGAVSPGKSDLYSVALHEIMHVLGIGTADTWTSMVFGSNWLGVNVIAANGGSGANLISGAHFASGVMSTRLSDGLAQEVVMDPSLTVGTRKSLTTLDAAMLQDIGYMIIPEPSSVTFLAAAFLAFAMRRNAIRHS